MNSTLTKKAVPCQVEDLLLLRSRMLNHREELRREVESRVDPTGIRGRLLV